MKSCQSFKRQSHKIVRHTQTMPLCRIDVNGLTKIEYITRQKRGNMLQDKNETFLLV